MKKIFTLCLSMMMGCMVASAQAPADEVFQFTDSKGTVIKDGSNITSKEVHVIDWDMGDEYLEYQVASGVYLSNTSDALAGLVLSGEVKSATNGTVQLCFPMNCVKLNPGPFTSDFDAIYPTKDNESLKDIQLHLAVSDKDAEAKAEIELQVIRYDVAFNDYGMPIKGENSYRHQRRDCSRRQQGSGTLHTRRPQVVSSAERHQHREVCRRTHCKSC